MTVPCSQRSSGKGSQRGHQPINSRWIGTPIATMAIVGVLLIVNAGFALPPSQPYDTWQRVLQFDHQAIQSGQWWRLLTYNFTHWDRRHFIVNTLAFALFGVLYERRRGCGYGPLLGFIGIAIGLGMYVLLSPNTIARGLSGVVAGQLVLAIASEFQ